MITKIKIGKNDRPFSYEFPKTIPTNVTFKNGVNILVGKNGSGKSTIINLIKFYTLISPKAYYSDTWYLWKLQFTNTMRSKRPILDGVHVYGDYTKSVFNLRSMKEISNDNILENTHNLREYMDASQSSEGEKVMLSLDALFHAMFEENHTKMVVTDFEEYEAYKKAHHVDSEAYTLLMDEPDRNLDIDNLMQIYGVLSHHRDDTQIIAAVHNPLLIYKLSKCPKVNIIELTKGYVNQIKQMINE